jgi:metal-responsive CopG/Arc/MetJ family transcriptional regulator
MVNITLSIPKELKNKMDSFIEINWSAVAREAFKEKISDLEFLKQFKKKSNLTEEEALKLGKDLNKKLAKRR